MVIHRFPKGCEGPVFMEKRKIPCCGRRNPKLRSCLDFQSTAGVKARSGSSAQNSELSCSSFDNGPTQCHGHADKVGAFQTDSVSFLVARNKHTIYPNELVS